MDNIENNKTPIGNSGKILFIEHITNKGRLVFYNKK